MPSGPLVPLISSRVSAVLALCMFAAALLAFLATPRLEEVSNAPSLEETVPRQFGDWKEQPSPFLQVSLTADTEPNMHQPYDQVLMRTYVNSQGQQVMLALAWGKRQQQEVKIHRPDLCYIAQGFKTQSLRSVDFKSIPAPNGHFVKGKQMYADTPRFGEAVSYWMRVGDLFSEDAVDTRWHIFKAGLQGKIPDGILVRTSIRVSSPEKATQAWPLLEAFKKDLVDATPISTKQLLLGKQSSITLKNDYAPR